jgi:hypothetical protein
LPAAALAARIESLQNYYDYLDGVIASILEHERPEDLVALLADPGRAAARGAGVLALTGGPAAAGRLAGRAEDVAPTLLYILGVPVSEELPGTVQLGMLNAAFRAAHPVRRIASYGRRANSTRPPAASPLDRDMIDRLRSLGYVR